MRSREDDDIENNEARTSDGAGPDGSGVRAGDEGPGDGVIEGLTIVAANNPSLGLTDIGEMPADDWAAYTGATQNAAARRGVSTNRMDDFSSTLSRKR